MFLTRTGKSATVSGLTIRIERVKVYNLHVEGLHLYAVGDAGVLVHNKRRTVVIGRLMDERVKPWARKHGYGYYPGHPTPSLATERELLRHNRKWLAKQMRKGRWIEDIGPGGATNFSRAYEMEQRMLRFTRYRRYRQNYQP